MSSGDVDAGSDAVLLGSPSSGSVEWDTNVTVTEQSAPGIANHIRVARTGRKHSAHYKVIIVGESGLGKTTARECLLHDLLNPTHHSTRSPGQITERTADIHTSDAMQLRTDSDIEDLFLRIVDTPGYGDHRDVGEDIGKIEAFIRLQYEKLYDAKDEDGNIDPVHHDSLVTCCLYFIAPHRIKDNDIEFLRKVSELVPIVPVIAKADTMTRDETTEFRQIVSDKLKQAGITCYDFDGDARIAARDGLPPFTLIADKGMRERKYAWGTCDLSNEAHSDFVLLKELVIKEHLEVCHGATVSCTFHGAITLSTVQLFSKFPFFLLTGIPRGATPICPCLLRGCTPKPSSTTRHIERIATPTRLGGAGSPPRSASIAARSSPHYKATSLPSACRWQRSHLSYRPCW